MDATIPKLAVQTPFNAQAVAGNPWAFDCTMITAGPGNPANKFYYPPEWVSDPLTAKLYNGAQCYIDHDGYMDMENRPERSMRDLLAYWSNVHSESNALKGRLNIVPSASNEVFRDQIAISIAYRKDFPDKNFCGFSIVQQGDFEPFDFQGETWNKVIRTNTVKSVDLVTLPARGGQADAPVTAESNRPLAEKWAVESLRGMIVEMEKNGSFVAWMKESGQSPMAFAKYTLPEDKQGEAEQVSSGGDTLSILTALRDKVAAAPDDQPMKHELRRGLDAALSAYQQKNSEGGTTVAKPKDDGTTSQHIKTKPGMTVAIQHAPEGNGGGTEVPTAHPEPDGDEQAAAYEAEAQRCEEAAEAFQKMAESQTESEAKGKFQKMAEAFKKDAESKRQKASEARKAKEAELTSVKEAEDEEESEDEEEKESLRQIAVDTLMREADLPENVVSFVKKQSAGKKLPVIKKLIEDAKGLVQREAGYRPTSPARPLAGAGANKAGFSSFVKEC